MTYNDKKSNAMYALNSYITKLLKVNLNWDPADYNNAGFFVPSTQQPEYNNLNKPYFVYASVVDPTGEYYGLRSETAAYTVFGQSVTEVEQVVNLMVDAFERADESAADVNVWMDMERKYAMETKNTRARELSFHSILVTLAEKAIPPEEQDGLYSSSILMSLQYNLHNDNGIVTRFDSYP